MNLKAFSNGKTPLDITDFVVTNNPELLESDETFFWITPQFMFKGFHNHEFESYSEVFNKLLMPKMGLYNSADYRIVSLNKQTGVVTERVNKDDEDFFTMFDILHYYKFYNLSLPVIGELIKRFCGEQGFAYNDDIKLELEKLYLYDLLTMQQDRGPLNYGIAANDNFVRVVYYDHGNMAFMPEDDLIEEFRNGNFTVQEFDEKYSATRLLIRYEDSKLWHQPKLEFIRSYLESADERQQVIFQSMLEQYNDETVQEVFVEMEDENGITVPTLFKKAIFEEVKYIKQGVYSFDLTGQQKTKTS